MSSSRTVSRLAYGKAGRRDRSHIARMLPRSSRSGPPVRRAIHRTRQWLLAQQQADGAWCAELEGDTILESETILLLAFLGHEDSESGPPAGRLPGREAASRAGAGRCIPAARAEISGSVKAYFALKLTGHDPQRRVHAAGTARPSWPTAGPTR